MHWLNPDQLPHVTSNVERFLLNPHGDVDGMILTNGIEVHSPPHLSDEICAEIRPGDRVTVRGEGLVTELGTVIEAKEIGASKDSTRPIKPKKPKHDKPPKHGAKHDGQVHA